MTAFRGGGARSGDSQGGGIASGWACPDGWDTGSTIEACASASSSDPQRHMDEDFSIYSLAVRMGKVIAPRPSKQKQCDKAECDRLE